MKTSVHLIFCAIIAIIVQSCGANTDKQSATKPVDHYVYGTDSLAKANFKTREINYLILTNYEGKIKETPSTLAYKKILTDSLLLYPNNCIPLELYSLSTVLFDEGRKDEGLYWFCVAQLRVALDANLCVDSSAQKIPYKSDSGFGRKIIPYAYEDINKLQTIVTRAIAYVKNNEEIYDHTWIIQIFPQLGLPSLKGGMNISKENMKLVKQKTIDEYWDNFSKQVEHLQNEVADQKLIYLRLTNKEGTIKESPSTLASKKVLADSLLLQVNNCNPMVLFALSRVLFDEGRKDEGACWFCVAELRVTFDINLCEDDSSAHKMWGYLTSKFGGKIHSYAHNMDRNKLKKIVLKGIDYEKNNEVNYDHRWIIRIFPLFGFEPLKGGMNLSEENMKVVKQKTINNYWSLFLKEITLARSKETSTQ